MPTEIDSGHPIQHVRDWLLNVVIGLNLCPFAKQELALERIHFSVCAAQTEIDVLSALQVELEHLKDNQQIATTLLILNQALSEFDEYNQFLNLADVLLEDLQLVGEFQIASFHPQYQFAGTMPNERENFTNRSPYPILHILREVDVEKAIASYADVSQIPLRNIARLNQLSDEELSLLFLIQ